MQEPAHRMHPELQPAVGTSLSQSPASAPVVQPAVRWSPQAEQRIVAAVEAVAREYGEPCFPRRYVLAKRLLDVVVAVAGLVACAPLFLILALLIKLDSPGPVFFLQERVGYRGRIFRMVKFRTMVPNSACPPADGVHKRPGDPRVTRIGRFLRRSSLDELPQLINVLRGEMSLVGPRPEMVEIVLSRYQPWQYRRFLVPQGLTGWWQVTGRSTKVMHEHTGDDLYYIANASLWFDLEILLRTIPAVLRGHGAF